MRKFLLILAGVLVVGIMVALPVLMVLYWGGDHQSTLEKVRDVVIVMFGVALVLSTLLFAALIGILVWVALKMKDKVTTLFDDKITPLIDTKVSPLLGTINETAERAKGSTEFMTEKAAAPVISVYGTLAKARAMTRTVTGRDKDAGQGTIKKILKR